jgi:hypothetical protein
MPISVTNPIIVKPKTVRHVSSTPRAPAPKVPHVSAPKAPQTTTITHTRTQSGLSAAEISQGTADNANLQASLGGGYHGTAAQGTAGNVWQGAYDQYGMPAGPGSGHSGDPVGGDLSLNSSGGKSIVIKNIPIGPSVTYFTAKQKAVYAKTGSLAQALAAGPGGSGSGSSTVPPPSTTPKVTAPCNSPIRACRATIATSRDHRPSRPLPPSPSVDLVTDRCCTYLQRNATVRHRKEPTWTPPSSSGSP